MVLAHQEPVEEFLEALPPPPSEKEKRKKKTKIKKPETIEDLKVLRKCTGKIFTGDIWPGGKKRVEEDKSDCGKDEIW